MPASTGSRSNSDGSGVFTTMKEIVKDYRLVLGAIGVVVYGVVRVAHDSFYAQFALTPESVGLSEVVILGRAALYFALLLFIIVMLSGLWMLLWSIVVGSWRAGRRVVATALARRRQFAPRRPVRRQGDDTSYRLLQVFFFLAILMPLFLIRFAAYFMRFIFQAGTVFFSFVLGWVLLLGLVLYAAHRLARFDYRSWRMRLGLVGCGLALAVPLVASLLVFPPVEHDGCFDRRPYDYFGQIGRLRISALERFQQNLIECGSTATPLRPAAQATMERALLIWVIGLAVLVYLTWRQRRDRSGIASSLADRRPTRAEVMGLFAGLAVLGCIAFFIAYQDGIGYSNDLRRGVTLVQNRFGGFSIQANPVCIASKEHKIRLEEPVMLLGETGSRVVVFQFDDEKDRKEGRVMKLPASDLIVHHLEESLTTAAGFNSAEAECKRFLTETIPTQSGTQTDSSQAS
jgi:hypothetical protein